MINLMMAKFAVYRLLGKKFICPFCIREKDFSEVKYVCPDCGTQAFPKFYEREPIKCKNRGCGRFAIMRECPMCGRAVPKKLLDTRNLLFSIVGVSNSGKTNYITVMLNELSRAPGLKLALSGENTDTRVHQAKNCKCIYDKHEFPKGTASGKPMPQIWSIKNLSKKCWNYVPTYTFTIFDGAGEDHEDRLDPSSSMCSYIKASKAIILVLDPLILSNIRRVVDPEVMRNSLAGHEGEVKNAVDVLNSVATYIKAARGIKDGKRLEIPVAVVLTKFDTILSQFESSALVRGPSLIVRDGKFNMEEVANIHQNINNWLYKARETNFVNALDAHFSKFCFFGVSSYGSPPTGANTLSDEIRPHRVLDPILWLFKNMKFID